MGDAVSTGASLDKIHKPEPQYSMIFLTFIMLAAGALIRIFATSLSGNVDMAAAELGSVIVAGGVFTAAYFIDFSWLGKYAIHIFIATCIITGIIFPVFGLPSCGYSQIFLFNMSFSSAYLAIIYPLVLALLLYKMKGKGIKGLLISICGYAVLAFILRLLTTGTIFAIFTVIAAVLLLTMVAKGWYGRSRKLEFAILLLSGIIGILVFLFYFMYTLGYNATYFKNFIAVFNAQPDTADTSFITLLTHDLLTESSFAGASSQPLSAIAAYMDGGVIWKTDFILVSLTRNFGWIALIIVAVLFAVFVALALRKCFHQTSVLGLLVSESVVITLAVEILGYFAGNLFLAGYFTLSLPFISSGTWGLIINAALTGFMLSVFRNGELYSESAIRCRQILPNNYSE